MGGGEIMKPGQKSVFIREETLARLKNYCKTRPEGGQMERVADIAINYYLDKKEETKQNVN